MPYVKFTKSVALNSYYDMPSWEDGDVRDVREEQAKYLCGTFSENFALVMLPSETKAVVTPPNNKADKGPTEDKGYFNKRRERRG